MKRSKNVLFRLNDVERDSTKGTLILGRARGFDIVRGESIRNVCIVGVVGVVVNDEIGVDDREK